MTGDAADTALAVVLRVAMEATGATRGRLVTADDDTDLRVVAAVGGWRSLAPGAPAPDLVGYVVATGQPQILTSHGGAGSPSSSLCAPCVRDDDVVGALELADKASGDPFSIDDLELASLFAGLAAAAVAARPVPRPPDPTQLIGDLHRLAAADPDRYATIARLLQSLLHA